MREIKFRAFDKFAKKFHYPKMWDNSMPSNWKDHYLLSQFTGLTDKHGNDIYEGDIRHSNRGINYVITWEDGGFIGKGLNSHFEMRMSKIVTGTTHIGNIYESSTPTP